MTEPVLTIDHEGETRVALTLEEIAALPSEFQIPDVSEIEPHRQGVGVKLAALLQLVSPDTNVTHLTLHASTDDYAASVPLAEVKETGILIYRVAGEPLSMQQGGPFRFLIPQAAACKTADVDACANVKFVDRLELTIGPGRDTRE